MFRSEHVNIIVSTSINYTEYGLGPDVEIDRKLWHPRILQKMTWFGMLGVEEELTGVRGARKCKFFRIHGIDIE